jgi:hypothetical protein
MSNIFIVVAESNVAKRRALLDSAFANWQAVRDGAFEQRVIDAMRREVDRCGALYAQAADDLTRAQSGVTDVVGMVGQ